MKKAITKFWGIGLVVVLLASLFVAAAPASGADLSVSTQGTPSALTNQIGAAAGANFDSSFLEVAPNGDLFVVNTEAATATVDQIYKSTTGGLFWAPSAPITGIAGYSIVDLAVSPSYATDSTVFVLGTTAGAGPDTCQVFISSNGGATFAPLGGAIAGRGTSIAVAPTYNGGGEIMVGFWDATATGADADVTLGGVALWGKNGVLTWDAATVALAADVSKVAYSPNFLIDQTRLAVGSTLATGTSLHTLRGNDAAWDALGAARVIDAAILGPFEAAAGSPIGSADIAMPSDFNASLVTSRTCYVSTVSAAGAGAALDSINRVTIAANIPANADLTPFGAGVDAPFVSIAYNGTLVAGTLYGGQSAAAGVWQTANPTVAAGLVTWMPNLAAPSGSTNTYVALANDIATSARVYASTDGVQSAVSVSDSGGVFFYQAGMIDTFIVTINDFKIASATDYYMVTNDAAATIDSLWKSGDAGATWTRVYSAVFLGNTGIVRPSPAYDTDSTVYFGDNSAAAGGIQVTNNAGASWTARTSPIAFADMAVKDQYTAYVGGNAAAVVDSTANGGWTWQVASTPVIFGGVCNDLRINMATGHLLYGDAAGLVFVSSDGNMTWAMQGGGVGGAALVEFDANYDTNNIIYGADSAAAVGVDGLPGTADDVGTAFIQRFNTSTPTVAWASIGTTVGAIVADILAAPDGTLYASDSTAANAAGTAGGLVRYLDPTAFIPATTERLTVGVFGDNVIAGDLFTVLTMAEGSNVVFAVNNIAAPLGPNIRTWTDTLSAVSPVVASPADGDIVNPAVLVVTLEPVAGAMNYQVQWNLRPDFLGTGAVLNIAWPGLSTAAAAFNVAAMPAGATVYYRTRAATPVNSQWSATQTFETQLAAAVTTAPGIVGAVEGGTNAGGWDANLNPTFQWGAIGAATAYEFQLSADAGFTDLIVDATGDAALGVVTAYKLTSATLDYNTTYYWRVRAVGATTNTDWSTATAFTTMAEPVVAPDPVEVVTSPAPIINIPEAPPATVVEIPPAPPVEKISPAYIWAIIIIGAVLVIAVIVLIVRTRRQV